MNRKNLILVIVACAILGVAGVQAWNWWSAEHARKARMTGGRAARPAPTHVRNPPARPSKSESASRLTTAEPRDLQPFVPRRTPQTPRIVLADFTCPDGFYHSAKAAADVSAFLQAMLDDVPGVAWIERQQIAAAMGELSLGAFSGSDAGALRLGAWLKADLLVRGRFTHAGPRSRRLTVEIVDLYNADVLASGELERGSTAGRGGRSRLDTAVPRGPEPAIP